MAKGRLFQRGRKGVYYAQFYLNGKQFVKRLSDEKTGAPITKRQPAEKALERLIAPYLTKDQQALREQAVSALMTVEQKMSMAEDSASPPLRIKDTWQAYMDCQDRPDSGRRTLADYAGYFRQFEGWQRERLPEAVFMRDITPKEASEYCAWLKKSGLSANTFNKRLFFMKLVYRTLKKEIRAPENPFESVKPQKLRQNPRRELTVDELNEILSKAEGDLALLLGLGTFTGLRLGDCCTLRWGEIDLSRRLIQRVPNKTAGHSRKPVVIGIPKILSARLSEIPIGSRKGYLLPRFAEIYPDVNKRSFITRRIQDHFEKCGIQTHRPGTGKTIDAKDGREKDTGIRAVVEVGFHSLRHTYVSLCAQKGVPLAVIQENVGHGNAAMTRHYLHVSEDTAREVADKLCLAPAQEEDTEREREEVIKLIKTADPQKVRECRQVLTQ